MNAVGDKQRDSGERRVHPIAAWLMSSALGALGVLALVLAFGREMPLAFGLLTGVTLFFVAWWNVATMDRQSEYPEGGWLTATATLAIATGVSAVVSPLWPLGIFILLSGVLGLYAGRRGD